MWFYWRRAVQGSDGLLALNRTLSIALLFLVNWDVINFVFTFIRSILLASGISFVLIRRLLSSQSCSLYHSLYYSLYYSLYLAFLEHFHVCLLQWPRAIINGLSIDAPICTFSLKPYVKSVSVHGRTLILFDWSSFLIFRLFLDYFSIFRNTLLPSSS